MNGNAAEELSNLQAALDGGMDAQEAKERWRRAPEDFQSSPDHYPEFLAEVRERFAAVAQGSKALFTTNVDPDNLWAAYLAHVPDRQVHNCNTCRNFIRRFGGLVTISADGRAWPAIWPDSEDVPDAYRAAVEAVRDLVDRATVTGVFISSKETLGTPVTGEWTHLSVDLPPTSRTWRSAAIHTAGQRMAELREDFATLCRSLADFDVSVVDQAVALLEGEEVLYRSEKVLGAAKWLQDIHRSARKSACQQKCDWARPLRNVTWLAVATAPPGFAHPRSTMIGTLLEDIADGLSFERAARRFAAKMHPLRYQRPQVPPSAGNIAQAEKVVGQLRAAGSLDRKPCRLDEVDALWRPVPEREHGPCFCPPGQCGCTADQATKVFGHLKPRDDRGPRKRQGEPMQAPPAKITWRRFRAEILPGAFRLEFFVDLGPLSLTALLTATNPDSPPILQWDQVLQRNPVSSYVWTYGSLSEDFSLEAGRFHDVAAVTLRPSAWYGGEDQYEHQGQAAIFLIEGARDISKANPGLALFPETLRSEFHAVRRTIEAYSRAGTFDEEEGPHAAGLMLSKGNVGWGNPRFRVTSTVPAVGLGDAPRTKTAEYQLDRWE